MTPLEDHIARAEQSGSCVLDVNRQITEGLDAPAFPGFVIMVRDAKGRVMLAELSIAGDRSGMSAVISAYDADGSTIDISTLSTWHNQVLVSPLTDGANTR